MSMLIVAPQAVASANLLSSNVVETAPALYSSGTTYALAATASTDLGAGALDVYTSLQGSNTNHTPASSPAWWKKTGSTYKLYSGATAYAIDDLALDATNHLVFQKLTAGSGHALPTAAEDWENANWIKVRASNQWALFDLSNSSQTTNPDTVTHQVQAVGLVDTIGFANVAAATIRVQQEDTIEGVVLDETYDMVSDSGIDDFYPWFFTPPVRRTDLLVDLYPYADAKISWTLSDVGAAPAVGTAALGYAFEVGDVQWGGTVGIRDYSVKERNDFGDLVIVERSFSKRADFTCWVDNDTVDQLQRYLADNRARPVLVQADDAFDATLIFGIVQEFNIELQGPDRSLCSFQFEGLT